MKKLNCWEYMKCGKGPRDGNGKGSACPVASYSSANGLNEGINGGRICWIIAETVSGAESDIPCLHQKDACISCEFRYSVFDQEGFMNICRTTGIIISSRDL